MTNELKNNISNINVLHNQNNEAKFKILIAGASNVGKSSLVYYFNHGETINETLLKPTTGGIYIEKSHIIENNIILEIFDTAGHEEQLSTLSVYCRKLDALILVFDINDPYSIKDLLRRLIFLRNASKNSNPVVFILANKVDTDINLRRLSKENHQVIEEDQATTTAESQILEVLSKLNIKDTLVQIRDILKEAKVPTLSYYLVSAKTGYNCSHVLEQIKLQIAYKRAFIDNLQRKNQLNLLI